MPQYIYQNPNNEKETIIVYQSMNSEHRHVDENGVEWNRVFTSPQASVDTKIDPFSSKSFAEKTKGKDTVGALFERSRELSEKRAQVVGKDPVKEKYYADWSKKRRGKVHPDTQPKKFENKFLSVELD